MAKYPIGFWNYPSVTTTPVSEVARWDNCGITCNQTPRSATPTMTPPS